MKNTLGAYFMKPSSGDYKLECLLLSFLLPGLRGSTQISNSMAFDYFIKLKVCGSDKQPSLLLQYAIKISNIRPWRKAVGRH